MERKEKIKNYLKIINPNIQVDDDIITFSIEEVFDRLTLYLNRDDISENLDRLIGKIVNANIKKCIKDIELSKNNEVDSHVTSIEDNGQKISYSSELVNYFSTKSDNEIFTGFTSLLSRYRRVKVVNKK
nr:MAG TPA: tail connector protein [Caudoviricetes sp.]